MAIGATIKVGMDASAVRRGIQGIRGMFAGLMGRIGRFGRGLGRAAGIGGAVTLLGLPILAVRDIQRIAEMGSEMSDMSVQTRVSVRELVRLQEALRMAGVPMSDVSRVLSTFAGNLQEAQFQSGQARDAFNMLGFRAGDFRGRDLVESFEMVLERVRDLGGEFNGLEFAMEGIFGGRIGRGMLRLANDLDVNMAKAARSSRTIGNVWEDNAQMLDTFHDTLGTIGQLITAGKIRLINTIFDEEGMKQFEEIVNQFAESPKEFLENLWQGLKEMAIDLGNQIGQGIADAFVSRLPGWMQSPFGGRDSGEKLGGKLDKSNNILQGILRKTGTNFQ